MLKKTMLGLALASAFALPTANANEKEIDAIRAELRAMKEAYESRIAALEKRLQDAQAPANPSQPAATPKAATSSSFNPNISMVLGGTYARLKQDPASYRINGFMPAAEEGGPGERSFSLGESEITLSAAIDPMFSGRLTFALTGDNEAEVEEAYVTTTGLSNGKTARVGRFLSGVGYLNGQHAHSWDFVDGPLAYQAFLGGQLKQDGVQFRWLAPLDTFVEFGAEFGSSAGRHNGFGSRSLFVHAGDDIGESSSWRAGLSYLRNNGVEREWDEAGLPAAFGGSSTMWVADAVYKWAPGGNATQQNFKLQGEYFRRKESGVIALDGVEGPLAATQSGWYVQGVYQFMPNWRTGLRYDRLAPGPFASVAPKRTSLMLDYSPSEFSRLRLQFAQDKARGGASDNQLFLQYIMSLGTHSAHAF
jgi:hypothetical protein